MWKMLKHIGKTHRRKLITTFSLVGLDNLLLLVYPVFGGWAINAVMEGKVWQAMLYGVVVLLMWLVGAARRAADTRTFTQIYTEISVPVVLEQRKREVPHSAITARVALSREFVSFFEEHLPIAATSLVSIFGACMMLLILEFWVGVLAVAILALFLWLLPRFAAISENQPPYPRRQRASALPPLWLGCQTTRANFQPRSLRLSQYRHGDERIVWLRLYTHDA